MLRLRSEFPLRKKNVVLVDVQRDERSLGEGLMRDLARRIQSLRKELGYVPTGILNSVHLVGLDSGSVKILQSCLEKVKELVRSKEIQLHDSVMKSRLSGKNIGRRQENLHSNFLKQDWFHEY